MCTSTVCSVDIGVEIPQLVDELALRQQRLGVAQKLIEQLELLRRERHGFPPQVADMAR